MDSYIPAPYILFDFYFCSSRLPKTSKDIDIIMENNNKESPAMTSEMTESESSTTETLMKVSTSFQALDYFEYVDSEKIDEDVKYLEKAIGRTCLN